MCFRKILDNFFSFFPTFSDSVAVRSLPIIWQQFHLTNMVKTKMFGMVVSNFRRAVPTMMWPDCGRNNSWNGVWLDWWLFSEIQQEFFEEDFLIFLFQVIASCSSRRGKMFVPSIDKKKWIIFLKIRWEKPPLWYKWCIFLIIILSDASSNNSWHFRRCVKASWAHFPTLWEAGTRRCIFSGFWAGWLNFAFFFSSLALSRFDYLRDEKSDVSGLVSSPERA